MPAPAPAPAPKAPAAPDAISIRPVAKMVVPAGYEQDRIDVRTASGAVVPLRTLLPNGLAVAR